MNDGPSPACTLYLWKLLIQDGEFWKDNKLTTVQKQQRHELQHAGFIAIDKRTPKGGAKRLVPCMFVSLTDKGWKWLSENIDSPISPQARSGTIFQAFLGKLRMFLESSRLPLVDFMNPVPESSIADDLQSQFDPSPGLTDHCRQVGGNIEARIREGYLRASHGRTKVRVRLADLRSELADVPRSQLDAELLAMERNHSVVLDPLDDPQERRPDDEAAALNNSFGAPRHVVYMGV
jgi:hypothetical protein